MLVNFQYPKYHNLKSVSNVIVSNPLKSDNTEIKDTFSFSGNDKNDSADNKSKSLMDFWHSIKSKFTTNVPDNVQNVQLDDEELKVILKNINYYDPNLEGYYRKYEDDAVEGIVKSFPKDLGFDEYKFEAFFSHPSMFRGLYENYLQNGLLRAFPKFYDKYGDLTFDYMLLKTNDCKTDMDKKVYDLLLNYKNADKLGYIGMRDVMRNTTSEYNLFMLETILNSDEPVSTLDIINALKKNDFECVKDKTEITQKELSKSAKDFRNLADYSNVKFWDEAFKLYINKRIASIRYENPIEFERMNESGFFNLISEGKISPLILFNLRGNRVLSDRTLKTIEKVSNKEKYIKTLPEDFDYRCVRLNKFVDNGEVYERGDKLYMNIDGFEQPMNLSRKNFEKLFPQLESVIFNQGYLGDCWLISALDSLMEKPEGKYILFNLFSEDGDDIYVKFPNNDNKILFKNGDCLKVKNGLQSAPLGMKIFEQAYVVHKFDLYDKLSQITDINSFKDQKVNFMKRLDGGLSKDVIKDVLEGQIFTYRMKNELQNQAEIYYNITKEFNRNKSLMFFSFKDDNVSKTYKTKHSYVSDHAYAIKSYNENTGMVSYTNPHCCSTVIQMPIYELMEHMYDFDICDFRDVVKKPEFDDVIIIDD